MNKIFFANLRAEMARAELTIGNIAEELNLSRDRLSRMLGNQTPIDLNIAFEIKRRYFSDFGLDYLFSEILHQSSA